MTLPILDQPTPCWGKSALFDSTNPIAHARAKQLCDTCPVSLACWQNLQDVLRSPADRGGSPEGTWAGHLFGSRSQEKLPKADPITRPNCGTPGGYDSHHHFRECPCADCRAAHNAVKRERRAKKRAA